MRCPRRSLITGPLHRKAKVHAHRRSGPRRVPHFFSAVRPGRSDQLPRFPYPTTGSPGLAPSEAGCPFPPRFRSQVFSTSQRFPSTPKLRGLVSCRNRSWVSPFRVFPSQESRAPLGVALLPCSHPPACWNDASWSLSPSVSVDAHAHAQLPDFPRRLWAPFSRVRRNASRSPWGQATETTPFRQLHLLRSLDPPTSPFTPTRVAPSLRSILSWVSASLEPSPSTLRILGPAQTARV